MWVILKRAIAQGEDSLEEFSVPNECSQGFALQAFILPAFGKKMCSSGQRANVKCHHLSETPNHKSGGDGFLQGFPEWMDEICLCIAT